MRRQRRGLLSVAIAASVLFTIAPSVVSATTSPADSSATRLLVMYEREEITTQDFAALSVAGVSPAEVEVTRPEMMIVDVPEGKDADVIAKEIRSRSGVAVVAPMHVITALESVPPSDTRYDTTGADQRLYLGSREEYPHAIGLEAVWSAVLDGSGFTLNRYRTGVRVAVVDGGSTASFMEDFGTYVAGWDYVNNDANPADDMAHPPLGVLPYHGSRVASIIRAQTDNGFGIAGTLYSSNNEVAIYKVLDSQGSGVAADAIAAMMDAADAGAKVINVSLGEPAVKDWPTSPWDTSYDLAPDTNARAVWQRAVTYCASKGALVVAASGNSAASELPNGGIYTGVYYPAACSGALAVGSIDPNTGARSAFSSYGPELDVVAPGENIWGVIPNGTTMSASGTSFSTPLVSGSIALLWSLVPARTPAQMLSLATGTADHTYGGTGFDVGTGWGLFDAYSAYGEMTSTIPAQAPVTVTVTAPRGLETQVSWSAAAGNGVFYRYGAIGGPEYQTTARTGRLILPADGEQTVYVRSYASDRWGSQTTGTTSVEVSSGLDPLSSARYAGADRYRTAAAVSQADTATADVVVLASGQNWPDGLTAATLARAANGPVLLTSANTLSLAARDEILRLHPSKIYVVGGTAAISSVVVSQIDSMPGVAPVTRVGGVNRYETARLVALECYRLQGSNGVAIVASGETYPDALSAAPLAAAAGYPILLTKSGSLPSQTSSTLAYLGIRSTIVVGGTAVISPGVASRLPSAVRVAGPTRYETSRAIADYGRRNGILDGGELAFATGKSFPDALSSGPLLARARCPVVLVDDLSSSLKSWLNARGPSTTGVRMLGGTSVIPYGLEFDLKVTLRTPQS